MKNLPVIFCLALATCLSHVNGKLIDHLTQCGINDGSCQRKLLQTSMQRVSKGAPELDIPPIDPLAIEDINISVLNVVNITLIKGVVKGIRDCVFEQMSTSIEKLHSTIEMRCSISIKGRYKAKPNGPLVKSILGYEEIKADGNAKVKFENLRIAFQVPFHVLQNSDGEVFLQCKNPNKTFDYSYQLGDKFLVDVDGIFVGKQDISPFINALLNDNWKFVLSTFGKDFMDRGMEIAYEQVHKFFDSVPAKYYISDDLTPYVDEIF